MPSQKLLTVPPVHNALAACTNHLCLQQQAALFFEPLMFDDTGVAAMEDITLPSPPQLQGFASLGSGLGLSEVNGEQPTNRQPQGPGPFPLRLQCLYEALHAATTEACLRF